MLSVPCRLRHQPAASSPPDDVEDPRAPTDLSARGLTTISLVALFFSVSDVLQRMVLCPAVRIMPKHGADYVREMAAGSCRGSCS